MFSEKDSECKCGYSEPAGSAHLITFITETLTEYVKSEGITSIEVGSGNIGNIDSALSANFLLPAVLINAVQKCAMLSGALADIPLTTVNDEKGFYKKRVVTTSSKIANPGHILINLGETVSAALNTSIQNEKYVKENILCFDYLTPIGHEKQTILEYVEDNENYMSDKITFNTPESTKSGVL